jgi:hypothetical protein
MIFPRQSNEEGDLKLFRQQDYLIFYCSPKATWRMRKYEPAMPLRNCIDGSPATPGTIQRVRICFTSSSDDLA